MSASVFTRTSVGGTSTILEPITLPAQTTPFSHPWQGDPTADPCRPSVFCPLVYNQNPPGSTDITAFPCTVIHTDTGTNTNHLATQLNICYPEGFYGIFRDEWNGAEFLPGDDEVITAAYPGTACPDTWWKACTYTWQMTLPTTTITSKQAQCCQPGFVCTTRSDERDTTAGLQRHCVSYMSEATEIWVSSDPPATVNGQDMYTWKLQIAATAPTAAAKVFHKPLPLYIPPG